MRGPVLLACALTLVGAERPLVAETLVASRTLPAREILTEADVKRIDDTVPGAIDDLDAVIGKEVRTTIYEGRPLRPEMLGAPAIVERNEVVRLQYHRAGLAIVTEGRALDRAAAGEVIRVLNLESRTTVSGIVRVDRSVSVMSD